jgi:hypothetical protein
VPRRQLRTVERAPRRARRGRRPGALKARASQPAPARHAIRNVNFVLVVREPHDGLGAPRARPPERSGAMGPRERRRGGAAGAKPPGSSCRTAFLSRSC